MPTYSDFVEHPRYGRSPRFTDLRPCKKPLGYRLTIYISDGLIEGTAIAADLDRQSFSPVPVLYYFDLKRVCADCSRPFIFFAEEQKYWYETLGFDMSANCVRCVDCRRMQHSLERLRKRYEELFHVENRSIDETLEMAECSVNLIQEGLFNRRQTQRVRMLLGTIPENQDDAVENRRDELRRQIRAFEG